MFAKISRCGPPNHEVSLSAGTSSPPNSKLRLARSECVGTIDEPACFFLLVLADGGAPQRQPQRVTKDAPVSVRTQIKYAKMKKSMEKQHNSSKKMVNNKYRRAKPLDYEDVSGPAGCERLAKQAVVVRCSL